MNLNEVERAVLSVLADAYDYSGFGYLSFAMIGDRTSPVLQYRDLKAIRRACRSLARKGLAEYGKGLWREDGGMAGAGYCATKAGFDFLEPT